MARREHLGPGLVLPLAAGPAEPPCGVLEAYLPAGRPAAALPGDLLAAAAEILGPLLAQAAARAAQERQLAEARLLREISQTIGQAVDLDETLAVVLTAVRRLFPDSSSEICLYDSDHTLLRTRAVAGEDGFVRAHAAAYGPDQGYTGWIAAHGEPLIVPDVAALATPQPLSQELAGGIALGAYIGLPLLRSAPSPGSPPDGVVPGVLGTLETAFARPQAFTATDVRLLGEVAAEAATAVTRAQTYRRARERLDRRRQELTVLQRVGRELNTTWDLRRLFDLITREAVQATGVAFAGIFRPEPFGQGYLAHSLYGLDRGLSAQLGQTVVPLSTGLVGTVLRTGVAICANDVRAAAGYAELLPGTRSELVVPICCEDQIAGVLALESARPDAFDDDALRFAEALADQAALAIGTAQMHEAQVAQGEQLLRRAGQLGQVLDISNALIGERPLDEVLDQIVHAVVDTAGYETAVLSCVAPGDPARLEVTAVAGLPRPQALELLRQGQPAAAWQALMQPAYWRGRSFFVPRTADLPVPLPLPPWSDRPRPAAGWQPGDVLFVPLRSTAGALLGVLLVDDPADGRPPGAAAVETLEIFANQAAIAIETGQLLGHYRRRIAELSILNDIGRDLTSTLDVQQLLERMLRHAREATGAPTGSIFRADPGRRRLRLMAGYGDPGGAPNPAGEGSLWPVERGLVGQVYRTGEALLVPDVAREPAYFAADPLVRSALLVPIGEDGAAAGVLKLESPRPGAFDAEHLRFVAQLARQTAIGLENARLYDEAQSRILQLDSLNELSGVLVSQLDLDTVFTTLYERVAAIFNPTAFFVGLVDRAGGTITYPFLVEHDRRLSGLQARLGEGLSSWVILQGRPLLLNDLREQGAEYGSRDMEGTDPMGAWLGAPLLAGEEVIGLLSVQSEAAHVYTPAHLQFLATLAHHAAVAIQNARLFAQIRGFNDRLERLVAARTAELAEANRQLRGEKEQLEELYEISHQLSTTLEVGTILARCLTLVTAGDPATRGAILLVDPASGTLRYRATSGQVTGAHPAGTPWPRDWGLLGWAARYRRAIMVPDVLTDPRWVRGDEWGAGVRSMICIPLLSGDDLLGMLTLSHPEPHFFGESQFRLVSTVAHEMAIAIHNAALYAYITEQAERLAGALRVQEEETSNRAAILESITDAVLVLDAHPAGRGAVLMVNPAAERLFNLPAADLLGRVVPRDLPGLAAPGDAASPAPDVLGLLAQVAELCVYDRSVRPLRRRFQVGGLVLDLTLSQVLSPQEEIIAVLAVLRDVTREVEVDRMKSEFISTVAHELRTPLTSIKGYTDLLLMGAVGGVDEQQRQFLQVIRSNADRLSLLVADMLDLSRIESGRVQLNRSYVPPADLIREVADSLRHQFTARGQTLTVEAADDLPEVKVDRDRIIQVLTNLLSNANKYTPDGGRITISARIMNRTMEIAVQDTGYGIAPQDMGRLFTRFFRADDPQVQFAGGTGLGLVIARSLVELHGGRMWAESEPGSGSTFTFTLPPARTTGTVGGEPPTGAAVPSPAPEVVEENPD